MSQRHLRMMFGFLIAIAVVTVGVGYLPTAVAEDAAHGHEHGMDGHTHAADAHKKDAEQGEKPNLHELMEDIGMATKSLRRSLRDEAGREDALARTIELQDLFQQAKKADIEWVNKVEDSKKREALIQEYRILLVDMQAELLACEKALINGDMDDASAAIKRALEIQDKGHAKFIK